MLIGIKTALKVWLAIRAAEVLFYLMIWTAATYLADGRMPSEYFLAATVVLITIFIYWFFLLYVPISLIVIALLPKRTVFLFWTDLAVFFLHSSCALLLVFGGIEGVINNWTFNPAIFPGAWIYLLVMKLGVAIGVTAAGPARRA